MLKKFKLRTQFLIIMLLLSLFPILILSGVIGVTTKNALYQQIFNHLESVREIKKVQIEELFFTKQSEIDVLINSISVFWKNAHQELQILQILKKTAIESYFQTRMNDLSNLTQSPIMHHALTELQTNLNDRSLWQTSIQQLHPKLLPYVEQNQLHNLYLLSNEGKVLYTAQASGELGQTVLTGELATTGLGKAFQRIQATYQMVLEDYQTYPFTENRRPLAFLAAPLLNEQHQSIGVIALSIPQSILNTLVLPLEEDWKTTDESHIIARSQDKITYRTDRKPSTETSALDSASIEIEIGHIVGKQTHIEVQMSKPGQFVLGAYTPLDILGLDWYLISTVALEETLTPYLTHKKTDFLTDYIRQNSYDDLLLILPDGQIFYTARRKADHGTNILTGKYAYSPLGKAVQKVLQSKNFHLTDYAPYSPSNGNPQAFIIQPLLKQDQIEFLVALELGDEVMNKVMQQRAGMGMSGETYLVGGDNLMRSNSFLSPQTHSVKASFANPSAGAVDTEASQAAFRGEIGQKITLDYRKEQVLSAYAPVKVGDETWGLLAEVNQPEAFAIVKSLQTWLAGIVIMIILFLLLAIHYLSKTLILPLLQVNEQLKTLALGKIINHPLNYQGQDEVAEMINSFQTLQTAIKTTIQQANAIAAGDYTKQITLLSYEDQLGNALSDMVLTLRGIVKQANSIANGHYTEEVRPLSSNDQLGQALSNMTRTLREITRHNTEQDWLKTGQMRLAQVMSGQQDSLTLSKSIIEFLTKYLSAQVGVFYIAYHPNSDAQSLPFLKLVASYAYTWRKNTPLQCHFGEGLLGQAALEQECIIITEVPADTITLQSGILNTTPQQLLLVPFLYEDKVAGVFEIATIHPFTPLQLEFIQQIRPDIGITINMAESRTQMQELLRQTQIQTEELQSQSEELQSQQEELRQANEELEERTHELERQQAEVQEKNTALKKAKTILEEKAQELMLASQYKSEFLANMSHELRTPLNSLLILAQLLSENKTNNLTHKQVEYARTIHSAGVDLLNLINDILDLSKVEAGKLQTQVDKIPLSDLIMGIEHKFRHIAENKHLEFYILAESSQLPDFWHTDQQRLNQILNNLLSNAFKFTSRGSIQLHVHCQEKSQILKETQLDPNSLPNNTQLLTISVIDSGIGIPPHKQQLIFEAFQQADGTTSRKYGGTGLGLSISRQLARLLGGEITLHSEEGKGSTFTLYLPDQIPIPSTTKKFNPVPLSVTEDLDPQKTRADIPSHQAKIENHPSSQPGSPPISSGIVSQEQTTKILISEFGNETDSECENKENSPSPAQPKITPSLPLSYPSDQEGTEDNYDDRNNLSTTDQRLLVVEDDVKFARVLLDLAHEKGFKCLIAHDGKTGLALAETYQPQAIILDISLPQMDGWSVMEHLKDNPKTRHIPVHFMSASHQSHDAKQMGAIGYLLKPVSMSELGEAFKKIEQFITKQVKSLLVLVDHLDHQQKILDTVSEQQVQIQIVHDLDTTLDILRIQDIDCLILDIDVQQISIPQLLESIQEEEKLSQVPIILYTERELTYEEESLLQGHTDNVTVKTARSPERLLDEATLFLHQIESQLPKEKRVMLRRLHDKEAILSHKKVLLVDDDMRNTFALTTILEDKNMEILVAETGREALEFLAIQPDINIVLMDIMMPEMDGYEAIKQIREQPQFRKLPIIALTAKAMKGDKAKCIEAGANDYLAKPIDPDKLISLMRVWLYR